MVARGDLGVEMDVARVPAIQKQVIAACHRARIPVITATQMLNSMETSSRPTRAEATDVFNAVLDGTDAVMLSGETAVGQYPVEAVATMSRIVFEAESLMFAHPEVASILGGPVVGQEPGRAGWVQPITACVIEAASQVCRRLSAALLVVVTHSGRTALALSKLRHATPNLALTDDAEIARAMALYWGVSPVHCPAITEGERSAGRRAGVGPLARVDRPGRSPCPGPGDRAQQPQPQRHVRPGGRMRALRRAASRTMGSRPGISSGSILPELPKLIRMPPRPPVSGPATVTGLLPFTSRRHLGSVGLAFCSHHPLGRWTGFHSTPFAERG